jgi:hypothetical protein
VRPSIDNQIVTVHPDELGLLHGTVYVVPYHKNKAKRARAAELVKALQAPIAAFRRGQNVEQLRSLVEARINQASSLKILNVDYKLYRTGEIRVSADSSVSPDLCDQVYYLIKDMAHRHYHHSQSDDNLLPLTPADPSDDQAWRRATLWCLARVVLEARRRDRLDGYKSALGMLAYAEAFQGLLGRVYRTGVGPSLFDIVTDAPNYNFSHTRESLNAKIAEQEYSLSSRSQSVALWVSTVIATTALWISAVQIAQPVCDAIAKKDKACTVEVPHFTAHAIKFLIEKPYEAYGIFLLIALIYMGRRALVFRPVEFYDYAVVAWSQALGASASRAVGANDRLGQLVVLFSTIAIGSTLMYLVGLATGIFHIPGIIPNLVQWISSR